MKTITKILFLIFAVSILHNIAFSQWVSVSSGTSSFLNSAQQITTTINYAAGFSGTVLKSTNNGQNWTSLTSPSSSNINKIYFPPTGTATTGWAGSVSGLYKTTDGGGNWVQQLTSVVIADVFFLDLNTGFALNTAQTVRKTTDGGTSFAAQNFTSNGAVHGNSFSQGSSTTLYILGIDNTNDSSYVYKSTNSGANWSQAFRTPGLYYTMAFVSATTGIMCGDAGAMKRTTNGGANWSAINTGTANVLQGILYISTTKVYVSGTNGTILKSTDGGLSWSPQTTNTAATLRSICMFPTDDIGFVVGSGGLILRTTNGGLSAITPNSNEIPSGYSLSQNYPNPFNPSTKISFNIPSSGSSVSRVVQLKMFDMLGREVALLVNEALQPGSYEIEFDAKDLPTGTYFYRLTTDGFTETKKMILIK